MQIRDCRARSRLAQCAQCGVERRQFVQDAIVEQLSQEFRRDDVVRSSAVQNAVSHFGLIRQRYAVQDQQSRVRDLLKPYISDRIQQSPYLATTAWQWYGTLDRALVARHGIAPYYNARFADYGAGLTACPSLRWLRHVRFMWKCRVT
jgi:hypothetical protein